MEADEPQINLRELEKDQYSVELRYHFTVVIRSYFMPRSVLCTALSTFTKEHWHDQKISHCGLGRMPSSLHAFNTSRLDHSNALLCGIPAYQLSRFQNVAARVVSRAKKYEHITPVLKYFRWLSVESPIKYKLLHGLATSYLSELINPYTPSRNLRSANRHLPVIPKAIYT